MGHWSVYCGVSNITISYGPAVFLPLKKNPKKSMMCDYREWVPATMPIFCEYDSYGEAENIERDFNTELIEEAFKCTIEQFCHCLCRSPIDVEDGEEGLTKESIELINKLDYMWINREVWDYMIAFRPEGFMRCGSFPFGDSKLLATLGIEYIGPNSADQRYNKLYRYKNQYFASDGTWLHCCPESGEQLTDYIDGRPVQSRQNTPIFNLRNLKKACPGLDVSFLENKEEHHIYKYLSDDSLRDGKPSYILGYDNYIYFERKMRMIEDKVEKISVKEVIEGNEILNRHGFLPIDYLYLELFINKDEKLLDCCADLTTLSRNMHTYSCGFNPFKGLFTPQDGEHKIHGKILKEFYKINQKIVKGQAK